jgi:hypothetical protein
METKLFTRAETCSKKRINKKNVETETYYWEYLVQKFFSRHCWKQWEKAGVLNKTRLAFRENLFWPVL